MSSSAAAKRMTSRLVSHSTSYILTPSGVQPFFLQDLLSKFSEPMKEIHSHLHDMSEDSPDVHQVFIIHFRPEPEPEHCIYPSYSSSPTLGRSRLMSRGCSNCTALIPISTRKMVQTPISLASQMGKQLLGISLGLLDLFS